MAEIHELVLKSDSTQIKKGAKDLDGLAVSAGKAEQSTKKTTSGMFKLGVATVGATAGIYSIQKALVAVGKTGFAFNKALEDAKGGLVSLSVAMQDSSIPLTERYAKANKEATESLTKLVAINAQTPHSLNETNKIYKAMYVSMKNAGATTNEMIELTRGISIAAGSAGIEFNSLLAGVDGLATGTVLANSDLGRFLGGLGLTNKKLKESTDIVALLNNKFKDFKAIDSYTVAASNLDNAWEQLSGKLTKDIFIGTKTGMKELSSILQSLSDEDIATLSETMSALAASGVESVGFLLKAFIGLQSTITTAGTASADAWLWLTEWDGDYAALSKGLWDEQYKQLKANQALVDGINKSTEATTKSITASQQDGTKSKEEIKVAEEKAKVEAKALSVLKEKQKASDAYWASEVENANRLLTISDAQAQQDEWEIEEKEEKKKKTDELNESIKATRDAYIDIVGSDYDKWLMNTNNTMAELAATGALTAEELQKVNDVLNEQREDAEDTEATKLIDDNLKSDLADLEDPMDTLIDKQIILAEGAKGWGDSFDGVAGKLQKAAKVIQANYANDLKYKKAQSKLTQAYAKKELKIDSEIAKAKVDGTNQAGLLTEKLQLGRDKETDSAKLQKQQNSAEIAGYANLAGAMSQVFEEGSSGAKAFQAIQATLGIVNAYTAITTAWASAPFPSNLPAVAAATAGVMPIIGTLASLGGSSGGGGGSSASAEQAQISQDLETSEMTYQPMLDKFDMQIDLLKAIERNGSAAALSVDLEATKFQSEYEKWKLEVLQGSRLGYVSTAFTDPINTQKYVEAWEKSIGVNVYDFAEEGRKIKINTGILKADNDKLAITLSSILSGDQGYTGPFAQNATKMDGRTEAGLTSFKLSLNESFTELQGYINDWAISTIDTVADLSDVSETLEESFDAITGTTFYETKKLKDAYADVDKLKGKNSYADYIHGQIEIIDIAEAYLTDDKLAILLSKKTEDFVNQLAVVKEFSEITGQAFTDGAKGVLNYIDSIEAVSEAMQTSRENTKSFIDSFKSEKQLAEDLASANGVSLATNMEELSTLFAKLKDDTFGLTDAELELLEANKDLLDNSINDEIDELGDYLDDVGDSISTLEGVLNSLNDIIEKLRGSAIGSEYTLGKYNESMEETVALSKGTDYDAFSKSLSDTISYSSALFKDTNFDLNRDKEFAQLVAANQFEDMEVTALEQIDYLKMIEENTAGTWDAVLAQLTELGVDISSLTELGKDISSLTNNSTSTGVITAPNTGETFSTNTIQSFVNDSLAVDDTMGVYNAAIERGITATQLDDIMGWGSGLTNDWATSQGLSSFAVGTTRVTHDMPANIHKDEIIVPKTFSDGVRSGELSISKNKETQDMSYVTAAIMELIEVARDSLDVNNASLEKLETIEKVI